jgi:hypothetical protein
MSSGQKDTRPAYQGGHFALSRFCTIHVAHKSLGMRFSSNEVLHGVPYGRSRLNAASCVDPRASRGFAVLTKPITCRDLGQPAMLRSQLCGLSARLLRFQLQPPLHAAFERPYGAPSESCHCPQNRRKRCDPQNQVDGHARSTKLTKTLQSVFRIMAKLASTTERQTRKNV